MTESFTIETPDGESMEIEVEEFSSVEVYQWAAMMPDDMPQRIKSGNLDAKAIQFCFALVEDRTVLTQELLEELDKEQVGQVIGETFKHAFPTSDVDVDDENDDGGRIGFQ